MHGFPKIIPNRALVATKLPPATADWYAIGRFALTFDGYERWGSLERCQEVALARRQGTLTELRTCLFFEQRSWRNQGEHPDEEGMRYIRSLLEQIRVRVQLANELLE
jgi:hypothetical protein